MLCSSRSEKSLTCFWSNAALEDFPVVRDGVWHKAQPILSNKLLPLLIDGVSAVGVGGARKRMKIANFAVSLGTAVSRMRSFSKAHCPTSPSPTRNTLLKLLRSR